MDQLSAHLDRGWDLLAKGDARGARASARRALDIDSDSPEAHNLMGNAAAQEGDSDEALEHFRQSMALDDGYIDPMLNAAEVLIHPLHDFEGAVALCDEVLEFAEGREEIADALLLKFEALLANDQNDVARRLLDDLPEGPFEGPMYPFLLGRAWFEAGDPDKAEGFLKDAITREPENADAHYYLGLVRDERGDRRGATLAFLEAREIDLHAAVPPWSLPREGFHKSVERALSGMEPDVLEALGGALVLVADAPGMEAVVDGIDPRAPVLIDGLNVKSTEGAPPFVRLYVYQRSIERMCGAVEQLEEEVAWQVTEEVRAILRAPEAPADDLPPPARPPRPTPTRDTRPRTTPPPVTDTEPPAVKTQATQASKPPAPAVAHDEAPAVHKSPKSSVKKKPRKKS